MRIFIVDDEEISCRGLSGMIGRILGSEGNDISTFTSSVEALEQAEKLRPDVIFLDIIMPELDGMAFTEEIQKIYSPEIIIISGNDDYNYVRRSFKMKVRDYLLKPIEFSELENFIVKLKNDFKNSELETVNADLSQLPFVFTAIVRGNDINGSFRDEVCEIAEDTELSGEVIVEKERDEYNGFIFTFALSEKEDYDAVVERFLALFSKLCASSGAVFKAAYSQIFENKYREKARKQLLDIFKSRLYSEVSCYHSFDDRFDVEGGENPVFFGELAALPRFDSFENGIEYREFIRLWFIEPRLRKMSYDSVKGYYDAVISRLVNSSVHGGDLEIKSFEEFNTVSEVIAEVKRVTDGVLNYFLELNQNDKNVIELALKYINENYQKNITLATVSNYYNLNYSYFSRIFKEFIGIPFSQYLLKIRMDKARELLINNPDFKISDIAKLVGYSGDNVQNFTRAFKNHFGKSPKNYKK